MVRRSEALIFIDVTPENIPRKNVGCKQLDDSGFVEDLEEADIGEDVLDTGHGVIELDDESFSRLQSKLEEHIETKRENKNAADEDSKFKTKPCYVKLYRSPVVFEEEEDVEIKQKRGRGRPPKNGKIQTAKKPNSKVEKTPRRSGRKSSFRDRKSEEKKEEKIIEIVDLDDDDDDESESEERKEAEVERRPGLRVTLAGPESEIRDVKKSQELSDYEKIREENIRERLEMLKSLGLSSDMKELKGSLATRRTEKRKSEHSNVERRKSARLAAKEDDDEDYVPSRDWTDDSENSSHVGVRRHPCKECANCLKPDCRRCIFCRDKKKFGGRNIKKQRCEFKERCSNPIISGVARLLSCGDCNEQFEESFALEQHRERAHHIQQVRRRSSRLNKMIS